MRGGIRLQQHNLPGCKSNMQIDITTRTGTTRTLCSPFLQHVRWDFVGHGV